jgi:hypothetical protein
VPDETSLQKTRLGRFNKRLSAMSGMRHSDRRPSDRTSKSVNFLDIPVDSVLSSLGLDISIKAASAIELA